MLFNEPKLLKCFVPLVGQLRFCRFSALQRAEIAEIKHTAKTFSTSRMVSVLFNEPKLLKCQHQFRRALEQFRRFSALQRAEIAEIEQSAKRADGSNIVSVLFNEPKLLKLHYRLIET